jgi:hypothetical protein
MRREVRLDVRRAVRRDLPIIFNIPLSGLSVEIPILTLIFSVRQHAHVIFIFGGLIRLQEPLG